eukprot:jgi/Chlat1/6976/Chrsp55S06652
MRSGATPKQELPKLEAWQDLGRGLGFQRHCSVPLLQAGAGGAPPMSTNNAPQREDIRALPIAGSTISTRGRSKDRHKFEDTVGFGSINYIILGHYSPKRAETRKFVGGHSAWSSKVGSRYASCRLVESKYKMTIVKGNPQMRLTLEEAMS